jgi:putative DNA primase/helicase
MRTNHKPKIRGTDTGIWRRIHLIPFKVTIPAEKRDPELTKKLMAELPGILNWAIDGCLTWQHVGLKAPPVVMAATDDYRTSQDLIGQFLSETCEVCPNKTSGLVKGKDLYQAYCDWCEEAGERAMPHRVLSIKLSERGFNRRRAFHTGAVIWDGIKLLSENARYEQQENLHGGATHE